MVNLPTELVLEVILLSLDIDQPCSRSSSRSPTYSPVSAYSSTSLTSSEDDPFAANSKSHAPSSPATTLRSCALASRGFRSLSQPLLFRHPVLPTKASILAFLDTLENGEQGARLAREVRTLTIGARREEHDGPGWMGDVDAKLVMCRIARTCRNLKDLTMRGMSRVCLDELEQLDHLRSLTLKNCELAPLIADSPTLVLPLAHLTLSSCHLAPDSLSPIVLPRLKALELVTLRTADDWTSEELADFLSGVAPQLRSFSWYDRETDMYGNGPSGSGPQHPLVDALTRCTSLVHLDIVNAVPAHALSFLPLPTLSSLRTLSLSLSDRLAAGASRASLRWAPLADSLLRDTLAVLRILLLPPEALYSPEDVLAGRPDALPAWVRTLQTSEALERVVLPARAFEDGLGEMVRGLEEELRRVGRRVELVVGDGAKDEQGKREGGVWGQVRRRERREEEARRAEAEG